MSKPISRTTLNVTGLEVRDTPAALASFNSVSGQLTITIDGNVSTGQNAFVSEAGGQVFLNGKRIIANGTTLPSHVVRSIVVNGSGFDNAVNLAGVSTKGFLGLDGRVTINGGGGNDTLYGSQFADRIDGGNGNDRILAGAGNDTVYGGNGTDFLDGGLGNDYLDGGAGDDTFRGNTGWDRFVGGTGFDWVFDFASRDGDRVVSGIEKVSGR